MVQILDTTSKLQLTEQQQLALNKMEEFVNSSLGMFGLYGYAGTGKSTIVFELVKTLQAIGKRVVLTTPTNKALGVLRKIASKNGITNVGFATIHQLLGLAPVRQGTERVLKQVSADSLHLYDFVVLDECSMIPSQLWQIITEKIASSLALNGNKQLLVMGDPAQLPPVNDNGINEKKSLSFSVTNKTVLTQVVRQGSGSPLLEFVTACRQAVKEKKVFNPFSLHSEDKKNGALIVKKQSLLKYALKKFSKTFDKDPHSFRILCYTNKRVEYWNTKVRQFVYGKDAPRFVIGERLIARSPIVAPDGKTVVLPTSAEFEIADIETDFYAGYKAWSLKVRTDLGETRQIFVLHSDDTEKYDLDNARLLKNAKATPALWKAWYEHNELFADIRNCWALTVHSSQGSTFEEVGIDGRDLNRKAWGQNGSVKETNQLWYVAASRAQRRALITHR